MSLQDVQAKLGRIGDHNQPIPLRDLAVLSDLDPESVDLFSVEWPSFEPSHRRSLAQTMQELSEESLELDFREAFIAMLQDEDAAVRIAAVRGLWEDTRRSTMRRLIAVMRQDEDEQVRAVAASTLGSWTLRIAEGDLDARISNELEQALFTAYNDPQAAAEVRRRALETLGYLGEVPAVEQAIADAYQHDDPMWRQSALFAMGRSGATRWRPIIKKSLADELPAIRYEAARAVGELGDQGRPLLPVLAPLVSDRDTEVALAAIWSVGQLGGTNARRLLEGLLREAEGARLEMAEAALQELKFYDNPLVNMPIDWSGADDEEDE